MKGWRAAWGIAAECVLLPLQTVMVTCAIVFIVPVGLTAGIVNRAWCDGIFHWLVESSDKASRLRLWIAGDPRWATYPNLGSQR